MEGEGVCVVGRVLGWMEGDVCSGEGVGVDGRGGCV